MSNHFDAEMAEVVVIVSKAFECRFDDAISGLTVIGLEVSETDRDEGIVQGVINAAKLSELQKLECVNYVRTVMTYVADFPPGDPRDLDGADDDDDE